MPPSPTARCSPCFFPPQAPTAIGVGDRGEAAHPATPPPSGPRLVIARLVIARLPSPPATTRTWLWGTI